MSFIENTARPRPWMTRLPPHIPSPAARGNRRRRLVFLGVFALACILSLSYNFLRPAEYRAVARLQITPAASAPESITIAGGPGAVTPTGDQANSQTSDVAKSFLTEVQVLTSRPVLEQAIERLRTGYDLSFLGPDPVAGLQSAMLITPVNGTDVVVLTVTGRRADVLAPLLNTVTQVFQAHLEAAYGSTNHQALANAGDEVAKLEANVAAKQREVDLLRLRYNIVSPERAENQVLASAAGVTASLSKADENVGIAEGKLRSLRDAAASGKNALRAQDDPTLANLEQRASQLRQDLTDLGRSLTPEFMAMDPAVRAKRAQLDDLERQIKVQRVTGQQASLAQAEQDLASARETADRIRRQGSEDRNLVREFSVNFDRYKAMQADLTEMQALYRAAVERKLRLEASELGRKPVVEILEAATTPRQAWRPLYGRDAAISLAGSLLLGLLTMWLVELFNRSEPQPAFIIGQPVPTGMLPDQTDILPPPLAGVRSLGRAAQPLLAAHPALPRELRQEEVAALLNAASEASRLGMLLLLSGISPQEALALTPDDVNLEQRRIHVAGAPAREIAICETLAGPLAQRLAQPGPQLLNDAQGHPMTMDDLDAELLCAAHDAGIESPAEVTPAALFHTYIAYLVRQGIRFADLVQISGRLPAGMMADYSALAPTGSRLPLEAVELVLPAVAQNLPESA